MNRPLDRGERASRPTPYPLEGVVSWNMNTTCNYRCSYCTQRFVDDRRQRAKDVDAFVAGLVGLPGDWEVKLSGGEPFRHPGFLDAVAAMVAGGLRVSVVTNFSDSLERLLRFAELTASRPGVLSASLHLEYADVGEFLTKAVAVQAAHAGSFNVTCVATRDVLPRLGELQRRFGEEGVRLKVQPEKQDRDVIEYTGDERTQLVALGGHNATGRVAPSFAGLPCWAGARSFILDHEGHAWRCYPARRQRTEYLGNLLDGTLLLHESARLCQYAYCNCTVPQERGMMNVSLGRDAQAPSAP
ncbi:MAG: radical SAM protein [Deltaproteobacteria bacterium]|nr:radical SAM protein [Deltaproteobacteria bacterium]